MPLHPRNRHQGRYDFEKLKKSYPEIANYVAKNKYGDDSIDFANAEAVKTLNRALLQEFYGITHWEIPPNYLCPPIPGRADYIHSIADVLASCNGGIVPRGKHIRALDMGVGANCIYPILGHCEYEWSFVGADLNPVSVASAKKIVAENSVLHGAIEIRLQSNEKNIFTGIVEPTTPAKAGEQFDFTLCNPPFHASLEEAQMGTRRKLNNLARAANRAKPKHEKLTTNFGGQGAELWCEGGENTFIHQMIKESSLFKKQCFWFSTLVSKENTLPKIEEALKRVGVVDFRVLDMSQGQKKSRIVAWTFLTPAEQALWRKSRWVTLA